MTLKHQSKRSGSNIIKKRGPKIVRTLQQAATPVAKQGEAHARRGLQLNVYGTAKPAVYVRTGHLRDSLWSLGTFAITRLIVEIGDRANYADKIEFGTGPHALTPQQLQGYLDVLPPGGLLRFGRSGKAYLLPGPYLGPAIIFTRYKIRERLADAVKKAWL